MRRSTFIVILLLCPPKLLFAEDFDLLLDRPSAIITAPSQKETLVGLSTKNIEARFGSPDKRDSSLGQGREAWSYGGSIMFFANGILTAWSDAGNLRMLEQEAKFRIKPEKKEKTDSREWLNDWTPRKEKSPGQVIDEIIDGDQH